MGNNRPGFGPFLQPGDAVTTSRYTRFNCFLFQSLPWIGDIYGPGAHYNDQCHPSSFPALTARP